LRDDGCGDEVEGREGRMRLCQEQGVDVRLRRRRDRLHLLYCFFLLGGKGDGKREEVGMMSEIGGGNGLMRRRELG
jgi:hypothetical protein